MIRYGVRLICPEIYQVYDTRWNTPISGSFWDQELATLIAEHLNRRATLAETEGKSKETESSTR